MDTRVGKTKAGSLEEHGVQYGDIWVMKGIVWVESGIILPPGPKLEHWCHDTTFKPHPGGLGTCVPVHGVMSVEKGCYSPEGCQSLSWKEERRPNLE